MALFASPVSDTLTALFDRHKAALERANQALDERTFFAHWSEMPTDYRAEADGEGRASFEGHAGKTFDRLAGSGSATVTPDEESPYTGQKLGVSYPAPASVEEAVALATKGEKEWKNAHANTRAAVLMDALDRVASSFFEIAYSTMHTTGQSFMMSFQASGPHANDRALEALALAWKEQTRYPDSQSWQKPAGKITISLHKYFKTVPRGLAVAVGCSTFPVWNTLPGVMASLATGNPVIVKPHPRAVYPLAVALAGIREALKDHGFDPNLCLMFPDTEAKLITKELVEHPAVKIIDYTGGSAFGSYIESLPGKTVFTEKAGVNTVILDSVADLKAVVQNLAFSVSLYSGQMCTAPQNFFIPKGGIKVGGEHVSYDDVVAALTEGIKGLATHPKAGPAICGAVQNNTTLQRAQQATSLPGKVLLESQPFANADFPNARTATPAVVEVSADRMDVFSKELFGPIVLVIPTENTEHSVRLAKQLAQEHGAISCSAYTTDEATMHHIAEEMTDAAVCVSFNLVGPIYVNQNAAFSDFHVTGGNPAGNASFTDPAFVLKRFSFVGARVLA